MGSERQTRFRDDEVVYHGIVGENLTIPSANPVNYHQAITSPGACEPMEIDAKMFLPDSADPLPAVMMVPGSLGVGPNHEAHAETLVGEGFAVCVLDPFGPRAVASTIANQTAYSFAASAFDVLATLKVLQARPEIDPSRIAAQGHSRGGAAVTIAACRSFADPIVGADAGLAAAYAVYPWCGHQFLNPSIGSTRYRAIIGERDEWCSVQEVQAQTQAIRLTGGDASIRVVANAHHSFDRLEEVHTLEDASVTPPAPTIMLSDDGAMIDPRVGEPNPSLTDRDGFVAAIAGGHGRRGAAIGGEGDQPDVFRDDMIRFHAALRG